MNRFKIMLFGGAIAAVALIAGIWFGMDRFAITTEGPKKSTGLKPLSDSEIAQAFTVSSAQNVPGELKAFFEEIALKLRSRSQLLLSERIDPVKLYSVAASVELEPDKRLPVYIGSNSSLLYSALLSAIGSEGMGLPWTKVDIVKYEPVLMRGTSAEIGGIAYVRQTHNDESVPVAYWLEKTPKGYKIYEIEELRSHTRLSVLFAICLQNQIIEGPTLPDYEKNANAEEPDSKIESKIQKVQEIQKQRKSTQGIDKTAEWKFALKAMREAARQHQNGKHREADDLLAHLPTDDWPLKKQAASLSGSIFASLGNKAKTEQCLETLGNGEACDYIRSVLNKDLEAADRYEAKLGATPKTANLKIASLLDQQKKNEASELLAASFALFGDSPLLVEKQAKLK